MKTRYLIIISPINVILLFGCVPASQTTAVLNQQTNVARSQYAAEMNKRGSIKAEIASNQARIRELKTADPNLANASAQAEIRKLEKENIALNRYIASSM
ncbi:MAG: hypothetical protein ABI600_10025 [Luteolibacter sp.]